MSWKAEGSSAVVVARRFNVTAARQYWLVKHGIIGEDDLLNGSLFSDTVVQVLTKRFNLLVLPDQLNFVPAVDAAEEQALIVGTLGKLIEKLPHVPYKALGLNFAWHLAPDDRDTARVTKELFFVPDRPLFQEFSGPDARFGAYLSKDYDGFRLKLEVHPVSVEPPSGGNQPTGHVVRFVFNFHRDLAEDDTAADILKQLARWNELRSAAERIVKTINTGR